MSDSHDSDRAVDRAIDRLEGVALAIARRQAWEQTNRLGLLWVHAIVGLFTGALMVTTGTALTFETNLGPMARLLTGVPGIVGGLLLAIGLMRTPRSVPAEAVGLGVLALWDAAMAGGFTVAAVADDKGIEFSPPWSLQALDTLVRPYPIGIYLGFLALLCVHLWSLIQLRKVS